jgi:hypothetical protein
MARRSGPAGSAAARHTGEYHLRVTNSWRGANYAYPRGAGGDRGKRPSYPIRPIRRARAARTFAARSGTAGTLSHVDNAIRHVYGSNWRQKLYGSRARSSHRQGSTSGRARTNTARRGGTMRASRRAGTRRYA